MQTAENRPPDQNWRGRRGAGSLFIFGGVVTGVLVSAFQSFARGLGGMGDGAGGGGPPRGESLIVPLLCGYFVVGAIGVFSTNNRTNLRLFAVAAHLIILWVYGILVFQLLPGNVVEALCFPALLLGIYFSPGFIVWAAVLDRADPSPI